MNNSIVEFKEENYIFFSLATFNYAFKTDCIAAIMQLVELDYPESMPNYIAGLLEFSNQIIKVIDLRSILRLETFEYGLNSKIIVLKTENDIFGVIVDDIKQIKKINKARFNAPPYMSEDSYIEGIYTDKDYSATIINVGTIERTLNSKDKNTEPKSASFMLLPKDVSSKETLHRRRLHYTRKMRQVSYEIIKSQDTYITFVLDKNTCCIKIPYISGFYKFDNLKLTEVPCTPDFIKGVVSIKGRYITIIDLLKFTEDKTTEITKETKVVVVEYEDYELGILANAIGETIDIDENLLNMRQENTAKCLSECVINNSLYIFLDIKKLFEDEKLYVS